MVVPPAVVELAPGILLAILCRYKRDSVFAGGTAKLGSKSLGLYISRSLNNNLFAIRVPRILVAPLLLLFKAILSEGAHNIEAVNFGLEVVLNV